jgi:hypothetical protein
LTLNGKPLAIRRGCLLRSYLLVASS